MYTLSTSDRTYHHGNLREALVDAALELIESDGEVSLRAAARRAGVSAMAPYRHFADKTQLLSAVAERGFRAFAAALRAADAAPDGWTALVEQGVAYVRFAVERPALFKLMYVAGPVVDDPACADAALSSQSILSQRIAGLLPKAERQAATVAAWSLVHGFALLALEGRLRSLPHELEDLARAAAQRLVDGLRGKVAV